MSEKAAKKNTYSVQEPSIWLFLININLNQNNLS